MMLALIRNIFSLLFPLFIPLSAYSGENLEGAMRAQQQRKQMLQQQAVAQQRAAIVQQQQRIVQEKQQALQQQAIYQQALQKKQMQEQKVQQMQAYQQKAQSQAYNQAYQQKVAEEIVKKKAAQQQVYGQTVQQGADQQAAYAQSAKEHLLANQAALQAGTAQSQPAYQPSDEADQVSDLEHIWKDLEISTEIWPMIMDREPKELTIKRYIEAYRKSGIIIRKPASGYVDIIDSMTSDPNAPMLKTPFKDVLKVAAIIEYDFDNGLDKDQMALKVLGEKSFESNKKRLGL